MWNFRRRTYDLNRLSRKSWKRCRIQELVVYCCGKEWWMTLERCKSARSQVEQSLENPIRSDAKRFSSIDLHEKAAWKRFQKKKKVNRMGTREDVCASYNLQTNSRKVLQNEYLLNFVRKIGVETGVLPSFLPSFRGTILQSLACLPRSPHWVE